MDKKKMYRIAFVNGHNLDINCDGYERYDKVYAFYNCPSDINSKQKLYEVPIYNVLYIVEV